MNRSQPPHIAGDIPTPADSGAANIEQARSLLWEVCSLASTAIGLVGDRIAIRDNDDIDALRTRMQRLHLFLDRIRWVADVGLRKLGANASFACAED